MAKKTMNKAQIAKFHKLLKTDMPKKEMPAVFGVTAKTLEKFTPEAYAKARAAKAPKVTKETTKEK